MSAVAFDGSLVLLKPERWQHIILMHPELKTATGLILDTIACPDEVYVDPTGAYNVLKSVKQVSDFLVVIYSVEDEGYIRTAYYTSTMRKTRRYRSFGKLKPS